MHAGIVARFEFARGVVAVHVAWLRVAQGGGVGANEDVARGRVNVDMGYNTEISFVACVYRHNYLKSVTCWTASNPNISLISLSSRVSLATNASVS